MKILEKITNTLNYEISTQALIKLVLVLLAIWLCLQTGKFWGWIITKAWSILSPFLIGFVIAYILKKPIAFGEKHHIKRGVMIAISYIAIFVFLTWLACSIVPMFLTRTSAFINSIINSVNYLMDKYAEMSRHASENTFLFEIVKDATSSLKSLSALVPEISNSIPKFLNNAIGTITSGIFSIIISIFMCIEWDKIRFNFFKLSRRISKVFYECMLSINDEVSDYIHSLIILMLIKFVEYMLVYVLIGHDDWLMMALLTSISLLIPYIGPTIVNCIGILTAIAIPDGRVFLLIILIVVLSQVDEYVIAPLVHSHNTSVTPLWALFSIFAFSGLFGIVGLVIAIPGYLALRVIYLKIRSFDPVEDVE